MTTSRPKMILSVEGPGSVKPKRTVVPKSAVDAVGFRVQVRPGAEGWNLLNLTIDGHGGVHLAVRRPGGAIDCQTLGYIVDSPDGEVIRPVSAETPSEYEARRRAEIERHMPIGTVR